MLEENEEDLSILECSPLSGYAPLSIRTAIKLGHLNAELIKVKNRDKYIIKRADLIAWLASKGRVIKGGA
ncbi:MAG: hypothetical protein ACXW09_14675 [Methylococcaceae bacterium]